MSASSSRASGRSSSVRERTSVVPVVGGVAGRSTHQGQCADPHPPGIGQLLGRGQSGTGQHDDAGLPRSSTGCRQWSTQHVVVRRLAAGHVVGHAHLAAERRPPVGADLMVVGDDHSRAAAPRSRRNSIGRPAPSRSILPGGSGHKRFRCYAAAGVSGRSTRAVRRRSVAGRGAVYQGPVGPAATLSDNASSVGLRQRGSWVEDGWCVLERVVPDDLLAAAQKAVAVLFPTAEALAMPTGPTQAPPATRPWGSGGPGTRAIAEFPFHSQARSTPWPWAT